MQISYDATSADSFAAAWVSAKKHPHADIVRAPQLTAGPDDLDCTKDTGTDAWKRLFGDATPPWMLAYIEDRAARLLPHSDELNASIDSYPRAVAAWDSLEGRDPTNSVWGVYQPLVTEGRTILRYRAVAGK